MDNLSLLRRGPVDAIMTGGQTTDDRPMRDVQSIAAANYGVIRPQDLRHLGLDERGYRQILKKLHRVTRGVYALDKPKDDNAEHFLKTIAALRNTPGSAASHISAAVVHGLALFRPDLEIVHLQRGGTTRRGERSGLHLHRDDRDVVRHEGIPVTPVAQTIIDCARTQSRETAVVLADYALHRQMTSPAALRQALQEAGRVPGISRARTVVRLADGRAESVGETRARLICVDAGIAVTPQVEVRDGAGFLIARMDLGLDGLPLGIEFDGRGKYSDYLDPDAEPDDKYWQEKVRKELVEDQGRILVPVYWDMLDRPRSTVARIRRGMERALKLTA